MSAHANKNMLSLIFSERFLNRIESSIELTFLSLRKQILVRNWLAVLAANIAAWIFEEKYADPSYSSLALRLTVCAFGIPLLVAAHRSRTPESQRFQKLYLFAFFTLLLPFMFSLIGLLNAAHAAGDKGLSAIWIFEYMAAIFLFYGLLSTEHQSLWVCAITHLVALLVVSGIEPQGVENALVFSIGMVSAQLTIFGFATLTHRRLQFVNQQKLEAAYSVGSKVAHEIRTPLLTIKNLAEATEKELRNIENSSERGSLPNTLFKKIGQIGQELRYANTTIDMLLVSSSGAPFNYDMEEELDVRHCVDRAIRQYPYANTSEKERIVIGECNNFVTLAPERLIHHVLLNLIRNAILSPKLGSTPQIKISYGIGQEGGEICVTDNGVGVPRELEARIFENFFSTRSTGEGSGLGLAFCKSVMTELSGDIVYSRGNETTTFKLIFNRAKSRPASKA